MLVPSGCRQLFKHGKRRHLFCPELLAYKHHRTGNAIGEVMVLHRFLEDFLHGAGTAGGVDDATERDGEEQVLADAVGEEFGNVGGKGSGRFVTIEPCGNAQCLVFILTVDVSDLECLVNISGIVRCGSRCETHESIIHLGPMASCKPTAKATSLHGSRPSTIHHQRAVFSQPLRNLHNLPVCHIGTRHGTAAHYTHNTTKVIASQKLV